MLAAQTQLQNKHGEKTVNQGAELGEFPPDLSLTAFEVLLPALDTWLLTSSGQ